MKRSDIKKAPQFLDKKNSDLHFILTKVKHLNTIYESLSSYLEPQIFRQCKVANVNNRTLTLVVSNGAIASHIRIIKRDLLAKMKADPELSAILDLQCKVDPSLQNTKPEMPQSTQKPALLSLETSKMMTEIAQSIENPALKKIMLSIAAKVKK